MLTFLASEQFVRGCSLFRAHRKRVCHVPSVTVAGAETRVNVSFVQFEDVLSGVKSLCSLVDEKSWPVVCERAIAGIFVALWFAFPNCL